MSEHRKWADLHWRKLCLSEIVAEHDKLHTAWQESQAELERIGKINDSMCDTIAEMEKAEREYKNESYIDGPFSFTGAIKTRRRMGIPDGNRESIYPKIDALLDKIDELEKWKMETLDENNRLDRELDEARQALRAIESRPALTWDECEAKIDDISGTGGLEVWERYERFRNWLKSRLPAPLDTIRVPFTDAQIEAMAKAADIAYWNAEEATTEMDMAVAIRAALAAVVPPIAAPERASDEELFALYESVRDCKERRSGLPLEHAVRAVRARVEAPLLAEIAEHRRHVGIVMSREAALKARVAELEVMLGKSANSYLQMNEHVVVVGRENDDLRAEIEAAQAECKHLNAIICERQPVDADAWKTPLLIHDTDGDPMELRSADKYSIHVETLGKRGVCLTPESSALVAAHLASYAAAHGCPVGQYEYVPQVATMHPGRDSGSMSPDFPAPSRAPETRPVKVRWDVTAKDVNDYWNSHIAYREGTSNEEDCQEIMDYLAAHAVIDVPAGVPSVEELARIIESALEAAGIVQLEPEPDVDAIKSFCKSATTAIRNAVLASLPATVPEGEAKPISQISIPTSKRSNWAPTIHDWNDRAHTPTPHEPTAAEVEALARVLLASGLWDNNGKDKLGRAETAARAAFAHFGAVAPIASADTLEQLAEMLADELGEPQITRTPHGAIRRRKAVAAILRAAKARVDVDTDQVSYWIESSNWADGDKENEEFQSFLNSRIVYGVQLPEENYRGEAARSILAHLREILNLQNGEGVMEAVRSLINRAGTTPAPTHTGPTRAEAEAKWKECASLPDAHETFGSWILPQLPTERAEMPSVEELHNAYSAELASKEINEVHPTWGSFVLNYLRPWIHTPTGWELDVTGKEVEDIAWEERLDCRAAKIIDLCRSRIRPTFGPCKECEKLKLRLEDSQRMEGKRLEVMHRYEQDIKKAHAVLSAALEGE